ncbi:MAG: alanine racemase [bacterium]|nr:alanine racemase [bacterium]
MSLGSRKRYERPTILKQYSGYMNKVGNRSGLAPTPDIDGVSIEKMVEQFGSPLFVMSEQAIRMAQRRAYRVFKTRYPRVQFAWSYKTNYLDAVCATFHSEDSWAEVVSGFEYNKARGLGVPGNRIIFNGPDKSEEDLKRAVNEDAYLHVDHFDELYRLISITESLGKTAKVAIRVNMDCGVYPLWDRFGFNLENGEAWQALKRIMATPSLKLVGLHTHIGTYIMSPDPYRVAATKLSELARSLQTEYGHKIEYIDLGGGFASKNTLHGQYLPAEGVVPTIEEYAEAITDALMQHATSPSELPMLILETGRALVEEAGFLITSVIANKRLADGRKSLIIDAGVNLLFTSFWYRHKITPVRDPGMVSEDAALYGPLCMNIDMVRESISLPPLNLGDLLCIHHVGAYDMTQWMQFITLRPNVVMVMQDGTVELIRKAETLEYIREREQLPRQLSKNNVVG